jgi:hypothetical protein
MFLHNTCLMLPPPAHTHASQQHQTVNGVHEMNQLFRLPLNVCHKFQDANDQAVAVLYFHSINVFLMHFHNKKSSEFRSVKHGGQTFGLPQLIHGCSTNYVLRMKRGRGAILFKLHFLAKTKGYIIQ